MGIAEALLSTLVATIVPSLYEESSRVRIAKGIVLIGIILILLGVLHPVFKEPYMYVIVLVTSVLLIAGSIHVANIFGELFSDILLDTYLCLYTGENCKEVIGEESSIESLIDRVSDLLIGKWTPLKEWLDEIAKSKNFKVVAKLSAYALLYQASSLSFALFIALILEAFGIADAIMCSVEIPPTLSGAILIAFGIALSATATSTPEEEVQQNDEEPQHTLQLIPTETYRKMLLMPSGNQLERVLVRLATIISTANPNFMKPEIEPPLATPVNLYECSPRLGNIIDELKRLEKHNYVVEVYGNPNSIYAVYPKHEVGCRSISGVNKFVALDHEKTSLDIYKEIMLINKENIVYGTKILIRELEISRRDADKRRDKMNDEKSGRPVAVMVVKAWKGCVKSLRIRGKNSSTGRNKGKGIHVETRIEPRRILSIFVVGRRDIVSLINIKVLASLRPASIESVLCVDDEEDMVTSA